MAQRERKEGKGKMRNKERESKDQGEAKEGSRNCRVSRKRQRKDQGKAKKGERQKKAKEGK